MTYEEAKEILYPKRLPVTDIELACFTACDALDKGIAVNVVVKKHEYSCIDYFCPICSKQQKNTLKNMKKGCFCERCGQKLSFNKA